MCLFYLAFSLVRMTSLSNFTRTSLLFIAWGFCMAPPMVTVPSLRPDRG